MTSSPDPISEDAYIDDINTSYGNPVKIVDLFAGIGGFHYGIAAAANTIGRSVEPLLISEIEESCQKIYADNHGFKDRQVGDINEIKLRNLTGEADIVTAGFPCQPFSNSGLKQGLSDPRGQFYFKIEEIVKKYKAKAFILENVPGIKTNGTASGLSRLAVNEQPIGSTMSFLEENLLKLKKYKVKWLEINSSKLGSPQVRKRVYIVGIDKEYLKKHDDDFRIKINEYVQNDFFHIADDEADNDPRFELSEKQKANIKSFMTGKSPSYHNGMRRVGKAYLCPGGNVGQAYHADGLVPTLTKVWARFLPIYFPNEDEVRPEYDTDGIDIKEFAPYGNYGEGLIRRASVEEVMRLQGFPEKFKPHDTPRIAYEHAGNAVNAKVIREIADNLFRYIL